MTVYHFNPSQPTTDLRNLGAAYLRNLKLRRAKILENYQDITEKLYANH